jgi:outer membrane receptor protein involved in Fe transport
MKFSSILIFLLLAGATLFGQVDVTLTVQNYLTNEYISDLEVLLQNEGIGFEQTATTDANGRVVFRALPVSDGFIVSVPETEEFLGSDTQSFSIRSNQNKEIQLFVFQKTTIDLQTIDITAASSTSRINRRDAEVSFELPQKELELLPVEGRDITRALFRLPNVSQATGFYPEAPNVSINGANSLFTSYLIDGLDNNERFLGGQKFAIPTGFTRNITVLTNNYSAEYGLTANGIVDITTRSGTNDFSGEAFFINRPGPVIDGKTDFAQRDLSGNFVKDGFQRYQAGVGFGGAIKKDKTFYYVNFEHTTDLKDNRLSSPALGVNETVRGTNTFSYLSGKLDHNWSEKWRSSLRFNLGLVGIERQGGGLEGGVSFPSAGNTQDRNSLLVASKNTYVGEKFSSQTNIQYARFRWNYANPMNPESPQVTVLDQNELAVAVLGHPGFVFDELENTIQFQQKFNFYFDKHTLKAGVGLISADHQLFGGGVPSGAYTVRLSEGQLAEVAALNAGAGLDINDIPSNVEVINYAVELRPNEFGARQNVYSLYLEDQWAATSKLNLTIGLRYDYDDLTVGGGDQGDFNNIAPRFNFNYKLGARSSLRGGYGIFYDKIPYAIYSDALQQNTTDADYKTQLQELVDQGLLPEDTNIDQITFDGNLTANPSNVTYLNGPTAAELQALRNSVFSNERRILNPSGYQNPLTHQFTLGYQHQINSKTLFYVDLVHNQTYNLLRLRNLNAADPYTPDPDNTLIRTPEQADLSRPIPILDGSYAMIDGQQVFGVARNIIVSETEGRSRYYAATFNLQHDRGEGRFAYRVNYTLSFLENNTEDINFRAMDSNDFEAEWGPSINDRRHIINGIGSYFLTDNFSITLAAIVQSGQPVNWIPDGSLEYRSIDPGDPMIYTGITDLNGDGASFGDSYVGNSDRYPGETRNSGRLPWASTFDLSLQYTIDLGEGDGLEIRADVFNVLNAQNLSGYSNNATQSNQIQVGPAGSEIVQRNASAPRQFQFGLRYIF